MLKFLNNFGWYFCYEIQIYHKKLVIAPKLHYFCKMANTRKTKSVKIILDTFEQTDTALSVVELVKRFQGEMNKTTVYRILERLEKEGTLHSFVGKDGLRWFARHQAPSANQQDIHPHFQCQACGKSECLSLDIPIPSIPNHRVHSANLILVGECEDCLS